MRRKLILTIMLVLLLISNQNVFALSDVDGGTSTNLVSQNDLDNFSVLTIEEIKEAAEVNFTRSDKNTVDAYCYQEDKEPIIVFKEKDGDSSSSLYLYADFSYIEHGFELGTAVEYATYIRYYNSEVWLTSFMDGEFHYDINHTVYFYTDDAINSVGSPYQTYGVYKSTIIGPLITYSETSTHPARAEYRFCTVNYGFYLWVTFSNNSWAVNHSLEHSWW